MKSEREFFIKTLIMIFSMMLIGCSENSTNAINEISSEVGCKPVVAVYPVWKHSHDELQSLPWDDFSHLAVSSIYPLPNGELSTEKADLFIDKIVSVAHAKGKKVIISVGGAGEASKGFIALSKDRDSFERFVFNLLSYVDRHQIDGIDIDWEYWTYQSEQGKGGNDPIESQQLVDIVKTIKKQMKSNNILTVDIMAGHWVGEQYLPELQEYADYVNLMSFDFTGAWSTSAIGYHSDYATFKKSVEFVINKGFTSNKILVGIPSYGIEFEDGKNDTIKHHSYRSIVNTLAGDITALSKEKFSNIYFETPKSVAKKFNYIRDNSLGGAFMFEVTSDHRSTKHSLLSTAGLTMNKNCQALDNKALKTNVEVTK